MNKAFDEVTDDTVGQCAEESEENQIIFFRSQHNDLTTRVVAALKTSLSIQDAAEDSAEDPAPVPAEEDLENNRKTRKRQRNMK